MFHTLKGRLGRLAFARECAGVLETRPVDLEPGAGFALLSQIRHDDLLMYLLAVKSFCGRLRPEAIYVVDDGTLTAEDRSTLKRHLPGHSLLGLSDHASEECPRGGTWERLLSIGHLVPRHFVIQLDADTLTLGPLDEVAGCIREGRGFTIGTWDDQRVETMRERRDVALQLARDRNAHVQVVAEANLDKLEGFDSARYIRGCSGFTGFPRGSFTREHVERVSRPMSAALGQRWHQWGTEQFTSNVIIANTKDPVVLPHPKYCDCTQLLGEPVFVHFIGTCRFRGDTYRRLGRRVIEGL